MRHTRWIGPLLMCAALAGFAVGSIDGKVEASGLCGYVRLDCATNQIPPALVPGISIPSGTGWRHVTSGHEDATASTPTYSQVGADQAGAAATALSSAQSYCDTNLTTHTNLTTTAHGGLVPSSRTVCAHALSADVCPTAAEVGADATGAAATVNTALTTHAALTTTAHGGLVASSTLGVANGVATLGADGILTTAQLPARFYAGRLIAAVRSGTTALRSKDGATWITAGTLPASSDWYATAWDISHSRAILMSLTGATAYTLDGGASWTAGATFPGASPVMRRLVYDSAHNSVVAVPRGAGSGAARSTDGVASWSVSASTYTSAGYSWGVFDPGYGRCIWISELDTNTLYTADGGVTFSNGGACPSAMYVDAYDPVHSRVVALPGGGATVSAYSTNGGVSWSNGGTVAGKNWFGLAYDPIHGKLVAVASDSTQSIFSTDGGANWSNGGVLPSATDNVRSVTYNPYNGTLYAIGAVVFTSDDGGLSWASTTVSPTTGGNIMTFLYP
jgi:hypothetical protein